MTKLERLFFRGLISGMFIAAGVAMRDGNGFFVIVFLATGLYIWDQIYDRMSGNGK